MARTYIDNLQDQSFISRNNEDTSATESDPEWEYGKCKTNQFDIYKELKRPCSSCWASRSTKGLGQEGRW